MGDGQAVQTLPEKELQGPLPGVEQVVSGILGGTEKAVFEGEKAMRKHPHCEECGGEINPNKYEDCERYYISNGRALCRECFLAEAGEYLERNTDDFARAVGAAVVAVWG